VKLKRLNTLQDQYGEWLKLDELPIGKTLAYRLIEEGLLFSVVVGSPGTKRGRRLISRQSLNDYLKSLAVKPEAAP
jgi:hypothetical protein